MISIVEENNVSCFQGKLKEYIEGMKLKPFTIYLPNNLYVLDGVKDVTLGPVRIMMATEAAQIASKKLQMISKKDERAKDSVVYEKEGKLYWASTLGISIELPSSYVLWEVTLTAHPQNAKEEALWKIKIASSLIRMIAHSWQGPAPRGNRIERHPITFNKYLGANPLRITDTGISFGGGEVFPPYSIDRKIKAELQAQGPVKKMFDIFNHTPKSLAGRVYIALGWLATARYATDQSERLLATMTAMEALFSRSKDAPINETIARFGSVILAKTVSGRQSIAKELKTIYGDRSTIVHTGIRAASETISGKAIFFVEVIIENILEHVDITMTQENFIAELTTASYGANWPLDIK